MTDEEAAFLRAAANLVEIQQGLLSELEAALGMSAYDYWVRLGIGRRRFRRQSPRRRPWRYHFHGLEVDAVHDDGREIRLKLGPRGMTNVFSGWSIGCHVAGSKPPWPVYARLRDRLVASSGMPRFARVTELEHSLSSQSMFAYADPELVALRERYLRPSSLGNIIAIPPELRPDTPEDTVLCGRLVLTDEGHRHAALSAQE